MGTEEDMIIVIDALNRDRFGAVLDEMFRLRARVFGDRLGWEVSVKDGMEIDRFDSLDPAYLVGLDDEGHVVSCARLLQTTGPHMLADVFSAILDGEPPLRSSRIWESTRFCVDTTRLKETGGLRGISRVTSEILLGLNDYGMMAGISDIVTVIDPVMDRVLKRSNCAPHGYVGSVKPMGKVSALAALLDCSEERGQAIRAFSGIEDDIFLTEDEALDLFARSPAGRKGAEVVPFPAPAASERVAVTTDEVLEYCASLIREAQGSDEREKALTIAGLLLSGTGLGEQVRLLAEAIAGVTEPVRA
jgi:acyl homoserine lactone synthase